MPNLPYAFEIVFSAAIPEQGGTGHLNEQWQDYWVDIFRDENFLAVDCLRQKFWNNQNIRRFYIQNAIIFVNKDKLQNYPKLIEAKKKNLR